MFLVLSKLLLLDGYEVTLWGQMQLVVLENNEIEFFEMTALIALSIFPAFVYQDSDVGKQFDCITFY